jgi:hypothetical protein
VRILHPYVPGVRPADQQPCWEALARLHAEEVGQVLDFPCQDDYAYAAGLERWWFDGETIVIVEHDIAPTPDQVRELVKCPELFCSMDYAGPGWPSWAASTIAACVGLAKLDGKLRKMTDRRPVVPRVHWHDVGGTLWDVFGPAHIHTGPVAHYHR